MIRRYATPLLVLLLGLSAAPAFAQASPNIGWNGWGFRGGVSSEPDQVYGGIHFELGEWARNVRFRPNIELGFGDDVTYMQIHAETHYVFSKVQVWKPYVGGSVGLNWFELDEVPPGVDDSDTEFGLMGVGGIETKLRSATAFFVEFKIGLTDDDPDFKIGAGWSWK